MASESDKVPIQPLSMLELLKSYVCSDHCQSNDLNSVKPSVFLKLVVENYYRSSGEEEQLKVAIEKFSIDIAESLQGWQDLGKKQSAPEKFRMKQIAGKYRFQVVNDPNRPCLL